MKKVFLALAALAMVGVSCSKQESIQEPAAQQHTLSAKLVDRKSVV